MVLGVINHELVVEEVVGFRLRKNGILHTPSPSREGNSCGWNLRSFELYFV